MKKACLRVKLSITFSILLLTIAMIGTATAQQTTGDILGTVTDKSGAVVPGATITVVNSGTHESRTSVTSGSGDYVVNLLIPGSYTVTAAAANFQKFEVTSVGVAAGDRVRVNMQMAVGETAETVTVEAQESALKTDSSVLSTTINERTTQDLPLNGRNYIQLLQLVAGANEGPPTGLTNGTELDDRRQTASVSENGQSEILNNQMIDGADNNERLIDTVAVRPSVEAIGEMSVQSNTYTAEVGRTGGAIVNIITKSGTNDFHGSVFEFFRNDIFDTSTFNFGAKLPKNEERLNQFGASLGGPIKKNKTFFFGDYEGYRQVAGTAPTPLAVPSLYEEQHPGDFSDIGKGVIPASQIDPVGADYFSMYPAPDPGSPYFTHGYKNIQNSTDYDARVDHAFNSNNMMYARFAYNNVYTDSPGPFPDVTIANIHMNPSSVENGLGFARDVDFNGLVNYIHTFNTHIMLELKAAYTRSNNQSYPETEGLSPNQAFGQPNVNTPISDSTGLAPILVLAGADLGQVAFQPLKDQDNTFQYLGAVTYTHGTHNIKSGATVIRRQLTSFQSSFPEGFWIFEDYPSLLQGQYLNTQRSLELDDPRLRVWEPAFYVQDDWHIARKLTLNLGLRYDFYTPYTEIANRISTWDPATESLLIAGQNGVSSTAGIETDHHGLAPRVGFAYTPGRNFVVRGGFGIGYFPMNTTSNANLKNAPFVSTVSSCAFITIPAFGLTGCGSGPSGYSPFAAGFPVPTAPVPPYINTPGSSIPDAVSPSYRTSYMEQFNLTLQKDWNGNVLTASYVGLLGRHLMQLILDLNVPPPNTCGSPGNACTNAATLRPYYSKYPNLGSVGFMESGGSSTYNALQVSFERRTKAGLTFNVNYNWAHGLDNAPGESDEGGGGSGTIPSQTSTRDYGNSDLDLVQHIAGTASYELPFGKTATGARGIVSKGWHVNVIEVWATGQPFTVTNATNVANTEPGSTTVVDRPNEVGSWKLPNPGIGPTHAWFNACAFPLYGGNCSTVAGAQVPGTLGDERRNQLFGPHFRHLDLSLFKVFPVTERVNVEFRAESFNLTNTANFSVPVDSDANQYFGSVVTTTPNYTPRELQFALKLRY